MFERERASPAFGHDWTHDLTSFTGPQVAFRIPIKCDDDMIGHWQFQTGFKLSTEDLPGAPVGYDLVGDLLPFMKVMQARSTALMCTNTSAPPPSG
jgi:hypothetical protein